MDKNQYIKLELEKSSLKKLPIGCVIYFPVTRQLGTWENTGSEVFTFWSSVIPLREAMWRNLQTFLWSLSQDPRCDIKHMAKIMNTLISEVVGTEKNLENRPYSVPSSISLSAHACICPVCPISSSGTVHRHDASASSSPGFLFFSFLKVHSGIRYETNLHALHSPIWLSWSASEPRRESQSVSITN